MTNKRKRRLKKIERARFTVWMYTKEPTDPKERLRHMRAVQFLSKLAKKAP